jgi:hypothetical protein
VLLQKLTETQANLSKINDQRIESLDSIRKKARKKQKLKIVSTPSLNFERSTSKNDIFKPSSTPQGTTSRSLSPIVNVYKDSKREFTRRIDAEINKMKTDDGSNNLNTPVLHSTLIREPNQVELHDIKRQQLFKQHIELIDEQKQLKKLLEQQELVLREKHVRTLSEYDDRRLISDLDHLHRTKSCFNSRRIATV